MAAWLYLLPAGLGDSFLIWLIQASFFSNWLILAALFCRRMKGRHAALFLSLAALLRLLILLPLESPLSLHRLWLGGQARVAVIRFAGGQQAALAPAAAQAALPGLLLPLWALGAVGMLCCLLLRSLPQLRQLRLCIPLPGDSPIAKMAAGLHGGRPIPLYSCEGIPAPLTVGVLRPRILLPSGAAPSEALYCALAHECMHIRYRHNLVKWLLLLACCLHWFNPLCWRLQRVLSEELELSCDRHALSRLGEEARAPYAHALLQFYARSPAYACGSSFGGGAAEARIRQIMGWRPRRGAAVGAGCAALLLFYLLAALPSTALVGVTVSAGTASELSAAEDTAAAWAGEREPFIIRLAEEASLFSSYQAGAIEGSSPPQAAASEEAVGQIFLQGAASEEAIEAGSGAQLQIPAPPQSDDGWEPDYGAFFVTEANTAHWADRPTRQWFFTITTDNAQNIRDVLEGDIAITAAPGTADSAF